MPGVIEGIIAVAALSVSTTVATAILGFALSMLTTALQMGLSALSRPKQPSREGRAQLQSTVRDPVRPREIVFGKIRKGGTVVYIDSIDNNRTLLMAVALAGHPVEGIDEIYFYDELAIDQAGNVQSKFSGTIEFEKHLGDPDQSASPLLLERAPGWSGDHRLRGIAYVVLALKFNPAIYNTIPNVTAVVRGARVLDTRDMQQKFSSNAALCLAHYLMHPQFGMGVDLADIDVNLLNAAANICDEDVPIKAGKTLQFDGSTTNRIDVGDALNQTGALTIEARVYLATTSSNDMRVVHKDSGSAGYAVTIEGANVQFVTRGLSNAILTTTGSPLSATTWKHIACVWNPTAQTKTIYVDGAQVAQATGVTGTLAVSNTTLRFGENLSGRLQDIRIWSQARSTSEIAQYRDKTLTGQEIGLVGYWKLDEKRDAIAEDATETPNDGDIVGATWTDDNAVIGTSKRYPAHGVIMSDQLPREAIADLLTAFAGSLVHTAGTWIIRAGAFVSPTVSLDENDLRGPIKVQVSRSRRDLCNAVRGTFAAPENNYQQTDFPIITNAGFEAEDGGQRIVQDIELPFTTSPSIAQRIAKLYLLRNREQLSASLQCKLSNAFRLRAGDTVAVSNAQLGWSAKSFEVTGWKLVQVEDDDGIPGLGVDLDIREISAGVFNFNPLSDDLPLNASPNTRLPNPLRQVAITSELIERSGYMAIIDQEDGGIWSGTIVNFVKNPLTGSLNPDDRMSASGDNFDVFDTYVQSPYPSASYESNLLDIDFPDDVRASMEYAIFKHPNHFGEFSFDPRVRCRTGSSKQFGDYQSAARGVFCENARKFQFRIDFDFSAGFAVRLDSFRSIVDKIITTQQDVNVVIPTGGRSISFAKPFHRLPTITFSTSDAARIVQISNITTQSFFTNVFNLSAQDVGGTISWQATGV